MDQSFGEYKTISKIGEGASGEVFLVVSNSSYERFAIKVFKKQPANLDDGFLAFKKEVHLLQSLSSHQNLVRIIDSGINEKGEFYIVLPFYPNSLFQHFNSSQGFNQTAFCQLVSDLLTGLCSLHTNRVIHRDIKPSNILIDDQNRAFITDFSVSIPASEQQKSAFRNDLLAMLNLIEKMFNDTTFVNEDLKKKCASWLARSISEAKSRESVTASRIRASFFKCTKKLSSTQSEQDPHTEKSNYGDDLSIHANELIQMIRGELIHKGKVADSSKKKIIKSDAFKYYWQSFENGLNQSARENLNTDKKRRSKEQWALLEELITSHVKQLDFEFPEWKRKLSHPKPKKREKPNKQKHYRLAYWGLLAIVFLIAVNLLIGQDKQTGDVVQTPINIEAMTSKPKPNTEIETKIKNKDVKPNITSNPTAVQYTQLSISVSPIDADILAFSSSGEPFSLEAGVSTLLAEGSYKIRVSKNGYQTINQTFEINGQQQSLSFDLQLGNSQYLVKGQSQNEFDNVAIEFALIPHQGGQPQIRVMTNEVTNALYNLCIDSGACRTNKKVTTSPNQLEFEKLTRPAVYVSWFDVTEMFIPWLSSQTQTQLRLPTEAEWQRAALSGTRNRYHWGSDMRRRSAHCRNCGLGEVRHPIDVRQFSSNAWQLFDMHGNVQEWTSDCWQVSTRAPIRCDQATVKGGSWLDTKDKLSAQSRTYLNKTARSHTTGFRLVELVEK